MVSCNPKHPSSPRRTFRPVIAAAAVASAVAAGGCSKETSGKSDEPPATAAATASAAARAAETAVADGSIPPPKSPDPLPIREGQWVRYQVKDADGARKFSYAVVGQEGAAHWLDVAVEQPGRNVSLQILVAIPDRYDPTSTKIEKFKIKLPGGKVQTFSGATVAATQKQFDQFIGRFAVPKFAGLPQEDVTVPAGRFRGCYQRSEQVEMFGIRDESTIWNHTAVPIMAMVKLVSKDGTVFELEDYGLTGAKPTM